MVFMVTSSFEPFLGCLLTWHYLLPAFKFYSAATANEISCLQMGQLKSGHLASKQSFVQVASCLCRVSSCWLGCWVDIMIKADVRSRQEIFVLAKNKKYVLHMMRQGMPHHTFSAVFLNIAQKLKLPPTTPPSASFAFNALTIVNWTTTRCKSCLAPRRKQRKLDFYGKTSVLIYHFRGGCHLNKGWLK